MPSARVSQQGWVCSSGCRSSQSDPLAEVVTIKRASDVGYDATTPVVDWLVHCLSGAPRVSFRDGAMAAGEAVHTGWSSLRNVFRMWYITSREEFRLWLQGQGFVGPLPGQHISARAPEFILTEACRADARVALLEVAFVGAILHVGRQSARIGRPVRSEGQRPHHARTSRSTEEMPRSWQDLDDVPMEDVFLQRIPMLKKCHQFLRGRLREAFACGLRERLRGQMEGDLIAECRGWKLFALVPVLLLHKLSGTVSIGRDELAKRADDFAAGRWLELLTQATSHMVQQSHTTLTEEQNELRRVHAAQAIIRQGQVSRARHVLTGSALAPMIDRTFELLQGRQLQQQVRQFTPDHPTELEKCSGSVCGRHGPTVHRARADA